MINVLNFKNSDRGAIIGFFDLRYHGLTIKGCRLMNGNNGLWFAFPQMKGENGDGSLQYFDLMFLTAPERDHVRSLILSALESQGAIERPKGNLNEAKRSAPARHRTPESEDLNKYHFNPNDDIPF